jgi:deoxyribose-phosphate aldolase
MGGWTGLVAGLLEKYSLGRLAGSIEHTLLKPDSTSRDLERLVEEAEKHGFACIVVPPHMVRHAASITSKPVCTVIGFPLGYSSLEVKLTEAEKAIADGASHIDAVWNVSAYKSGMRGYVEEEVRSLASLAHGRGIIVKIIIETSLLTPTEIMDASRIVVEAGADYVKTKTGFGSRGASLMDVALIRHVVKGDAKIKAAGGIRDALTALLMLEAGADRLGASRSVQIVESYRLLEEIAK